MCEYMDDCEEYVSECDQIDNSDLESEPCCYIEKVCPHCCRAECVCSDFDVEPNMGAH
jgi:hypothetical protein